MKVWMVYYDNYDGDVIDSLYDSKEKAEVKAEIINDEMYKSSGVRGHYCIREYDLL